MEVLDVLGKICVSFIFAIVSSWLANSIRSLNISSLLILVFETLVGFWTVMVALWFIVLFIVI